MLNYDTNIEQMTSKQISDICECLLDKTTNEVRINRECGE